MSLHSVKPIVFLPGWGLGIGPLTELAEQLGGHVFPLPGYPATHHNTQLINDFQAACQSIANQLDEQTLLCGWSLGGLLAQQVAAIAPEKVSRLILMSSTPSFVQRADWMDATPLNVLDDFIEAIAENPSPAISQFVRGFNRGDQHSKAVTRNLLDSMSPLPDTAVLLAGLRWLREIDLRDQISSIQAPTLLIHGARDPLMPVSGATAFAERLANAQLKVLSDCAHAPFVSNPTAVLVYLREFLGLNT